MLQTVKQVGRVLGAAVLLGLTVGCSYVYDVRFIVGIPVGTTSPIVLEVIDAHGMDERSVVVPLASQASVTSTVSICCAPEPMVSMQAFVDLNNNAVHDVGEPLSIWPGGPSRLTGNTSVQLRLASPVAPSTNAAPTTP